MTSSQPTPSEQTRQEPFRWDRTDNAKAFDHFRSPDASSQRQYAEEHDIPRSTLGYWLRRDDPPQADPVAAFCHSAAGQQFLRGIVVAALCTFSLEGACGIRPLSTFLQRCGLDRFVASSRGALHPLLGALETHLATFGEQERALLAQNLPQEKENKKTITLAVDEHFHSVKNCLVGIEPVSNFILVECYRDRRDAVTWTEAIKEGASGMNLDIVLLTSDLAKGLLCCAEKGLEVAHSPDLFHGQRDLLKPLLLPLSRPIQQAQKDLEKADKLVELLDVPAQQKQPPEELNALIDAVREQMGSETRLKEAKERQEKAVQQVRGVGDEYHPFDRQTGRPLTAEEVGKRLNEHLGELEEVVVEAGLGERPQKAVSKGRAWVETLVGCVAWFWTLADSRIEEWDLSEKQEQEVRAKLLPGYYWEMAAGRARTPEERIRLKEMAEALKKSAWQEGGPWPRWTPRRRRRSNVWRKKARGCSRDRVRAWKEETAGCRYTTTVTAK